MLLPAMLVRLIGGKFGYLGRKLAIDFWVIAKPAALLAFLLLGLTCRRWVMIFAVVALVDLYAYLLGLVFLRPFYTKPASYGRSVLSLSINFLEAALAFSILYLNTGALAGPLGTVRSWSEAIYFSIITAATVGYGDIKPATDTGHALVVAQVLSSLFFLAIALTTFVSGLSSSSDLGTDRPKRTLGARETKNDA
jgi:voltage-gated potassium channel Kch